MLMPSEDAVFAKIIAPFDDVSTCGQDLRDEMGVGSIYSALRDARSAARMHERSFDDDPERASGTPEEWRGVEALAIEALSTLSKDIEVASWLMEALTRRAGLAGLAFGARIMTHLVRDFWTVGLFPMLEADDPEARTFAVSGLSGADRDGSLIQPLRKTVLFEMEDGRPVTLWEYERARARAASAAQGKHVAVANDGLPPLERMEAVALGSGQAVLREIGLAAEQACTAWDALHDAFAEACSHAEPAVEQPSMRRMTSLLDDIRTVARRYVPEAMLQPPEPVMEVEVMACGMEEDMAEGVSAPAPMPAVPARPTRGDLLDSAMQIALQFREMEPHSPFSYTLENAIRRARMSLPDLLREIVMDDSSRNEILTRLGIEALEI